MQAIVTKYVPATNTKPSRIKATCSAGSIFVSYSYDHDEEGCHRQAAEALVKKMGWIEQSGYQGLVSGGLPDNKGYVFVFSYEAAYQRVLEELIFPAANASSPSELVHLARVAITARG